ncbi:MAG: HAMP domain-containing histidine kinase [Nitrospiraceae bacterium]|nr:MAG: HAMP domain-containing histidine kinase [Nitrospiraceae bacterium]
MKLKIWHKMIIGISIPSLIAMLGGILTYGYINDVKTRQGFVRIVDDFKEQVLEVRRNERNFLHDKSNEHYQALHESLAVLAVSLGSLTPETLDIISREKVAGLDGLVREYSALTKSLNDSFREETRVTQIVADEGRRLEATVAQGRLAEELSTSFILRLRLLEKNYLLLRDDQSQRELDSGLAQITNVTPFCTDCTSYIDAVRALFASYEKSDSLSSSLHSAGNRLEEVTAQMALHERHRINKFITQTQKLLLAGLVLLCTLGPLFVYKTSSFIAAPIKRLADITRRIAEGDTSLRAPLKEQDETHSLALSFNTMIDSLLKSQESLKESLALLNEKQAQLVESEKRASMGFLVAGVAHELNNPLNNISLVAETMKEEMKDLSFKELSSYVQDILRQSERAHAIVVNLLDFARARKSSEMRRLDVVAVVKDSIHLVANQLRMKNIRLIEDIPQGAFYVMGNHSKLEQVLVSIINNAIQAMTSAGTLTIRVGTDTGAQNILISISDTGKGIPEADIKNIFEPFFTTKPPGEGTGLGLAVSLTLVREHNGSISVKSTAGEGTTFTVSLPLLDKAGP